MTYIELNDETITWTTGDLTSWRQTLEDGSMTVGLPHVKLPRLVDLQRMATQVALGAFARERLIIEEGGETDSYREIWTDWTQWMKGSYEAYTLELEAKIDYMGHLSWRIYAREPGNDYPFSAGTYMAPDFALAWFIAVAWEYHKEWLSEQLEVVGGLS